MEIDQIIALYHQDQPISYTLKSIRLQEDDSRWVLFLNYRDQKYVIKIASNEFTTRERVNGWNRIIEEYEKLGYYSPRVLKSLNGRDSEELLFNGRQCVVWEEEYARYCLYETLEKAVYTRPDGKYVYHDEVFEFIGKVGQKHLSDFPYPSGWARFVPLSKDDTEDEVMECVETFEDLVKNKAPQFFKRWERIRTLFEENKMRLQKIYDSLPKSVFQGDCFRDNLILDEGGHFKGVIDYNLAGEDVVLNIMLSTILFGYTYQRKQSSNLNLLPELNRETQDSVIEIVLTTLRDLRKFYTFEESEVIAAPYLFKYIYSIQYSQIDAFEKYQKDDGKLNQLFDYMEQELLREDIDFRGAMLG